MNVLPSVLALAGVILGAALSYFFTLASERRRERWALRREWREKKLLAYSTYLRLDLTRAPQHPLMPRSCVARISVAP